MENTKGYTKGQLELFKAVKEGKELKANQKGLLTKLLKEMGYTTETPSQPTETPSQPTETKELELTLENWETHTEEQRETLKASLLKSKYGNGGENIGIFPNLLDYKINTFITKEYGEKVTKAPNQNTLNQYKGNGQIILLPLEIGTFHYLTILIPNKEISLDTWELVTTDKPYINYTTHNKIGNIKVKEGEYLITNIQSNSNKSWNNGKRLSNLLELNYNIKEMELVKAVNSRSKIPPNQKWLKKDITEKGKVTFKEYSTNTFKPTGKEFNSIGEYIGKELAKEMEGVNLLEYIQ